MALRSAAIALIALFSAGFAFAVEGPPQAPKNAVSEQAPKYRIEEASGDASKGEAHQIKEFSDGKLLRITTQYTNFNIKVEEFRPDGTRLGVIEQLQGETKTTLFTGDGKGLKTVSTINKGTVCTTEYRPDGKTVWTERTSDGAGNQSKYFGTDGKLRSHRTILKTGQMTVIVYDANGVEQYRQLWTPGIAGYVLIQVTEKTATGERRISFLGKNVSKSDYYKQDGSFDKTEPANQISPAFDMKRAEELDSKDDPTAPTKPTARR